MLKPKCVCIIFLCAVAAGAVIWNNGYGWGYQIASESVRDAYEQYRLRACWGPSEVVRSQSGKAQRVIGPWRL